jgi:hypothetical protein
MKTFKLIEKSIIGNILVMNGKKYVSAQYISKKMNDNDAKINYNSFMGLKGIKYFELRK